MLNLYYSSESNIGKKVHTYLTSTEKKLLAIDVTKTNVTETQWISISKNLGIHIKNLIDTNASDLSFKDKDIANFTETDWLKILDKTPEVLNFPIVIHNDKYYQIKDAQDALQFIENDSKAIDE